MRISPEVLAELIDIFVEGISEMRDVSDRMRGLDLEAGPDGSLIFTERWLRDNPRAMPDQVS